MARMAKDIRYALRTLRRSPGFTADRDPHAGARHRRQHRDLLGHQRGAASPAAVPEPERLVTMTHDYPVRCTCRRRCLGARVPRLHRAEAGVCQRRRCSPDGRRPSPGTAIRRGSGVTVAGDYFATFGVQPLLGRALRADESTAGDDKVVVLSEGFWRGSYGADKTIVGRTISSTARATRWWA